MPEASSNREATLVLFVSSLAPTDLSPAPALACAQTGGLMHVSGLIAAENLVLGVLGVQIVGFRWRRHSVPGFLRGGWMEALSYQVHVFLFLL